MTTIDASDALARMIEAGSAWDLILTNNVETGEWWRRDGEPLWRPQDGDSFVSLADLTPSHRRHLYAWLCRRAANISWDCAMGPRMNCGGDDGGNLDAARDEHLDWMLDNPVEWLIGQPFMMALGALLLGDGNRAVVEDWHRYAAGGPSPERRPRGLVGELPAWLADADEPALEPEPMCMCPSYYSPEDAPMAEWCPAHGTAMVTCPVCRARSEYRDRCSACHGVGELTVAEAEAASIRWRNLIVGRRRIEEGDGWAGPAPDWTLS